MLSRIANPATRASARAARKAARALGGARFASTDNVKKTLVHGEHLKGGGVMVDFAGYAMPVQYKDSAQAQSIIDSVKQVRTKAGLFDVSHMCSLRWRGKDAIKFVESVTVADIQGLPMHTGTLSVIPNDQGGIIDDTMITKTCDAQGDHIYQVINAGCADKDLAYFKAKMADFKGDVSLTVEWDDRGLYALQGPEAVKVMERLAPKYDFKAMGFGVAANMQVAGMDCFVARCGYTGEDGFEVFVPGKDAVGLWQLLCDQPEVMPSGLGARDTLRLEAGLCLYGHDIDDTTSPSEAGLTWTVGKARREAGATPFPGSERILREIADPKTQVKRVRTGLVPKGAPAREGAEITDLDGKVIGKVTSGAVSPILKHNISMGYFDKPFNKAGTEVLVKVRGKSSPAVVTKMPFVPTKYYKP